ncbi:MAG TPA: carboxypeptidase-like regulatory domain-containing protein, partial [Gemmatimonadales bacterium]
MTSFGRRAKVAWLLASVSFLGMAAPVAGYGQSLTQGALRGTVVAAGLTVSDVLLSIEDETGTIVRRTRTDVEGHFNIAILAPGGYSILAEKAGYQPQRQR